MYLERRKLQAYSCTEKARTIATGRDSEAPCCKTLQDDAGAGQVAATTS